MAIPINRNFKYDYQTLLQHLRLKGLQPKTIEAYLRGIGRSRRSVFLIKISGFVRLFRVVCRSCGFSSSHHEQIQALFQAHFTLEINPLFRLISHWKRLLHFEP